MYFGSKEDAKRLILSARKRRGRQVRTSELADVGLIGGLGLAHPVAFLGCISSTAEPYCRLSLRRRTRGRRPFMVVFRSAKERLANALSRSERLHYSFNAYPAAPVQRPGRPETHNDAGSSRLVRRGCPTAVCQARRDFALAEKDRCRRWFAA